MIHQCTTDSSRFPRGDDVDVEVGHTVPQLTWEFTINTGIFLFITDRFITLLIMSCLTSLYNICRCQMRYYRKIVWTTVTCRIGIITTPEKLTRLFLMYELISFMRQQVSCMIFFLFDSNVTSRRKDKH